MGAIYDDRMADNVRALRSVSSEPLGSTERHPGEPLWRDVLGRRLRDLRRERGEILSDTAARAGISPQYLSEIERGLKEPSSEMIAAVAGALDATLGDLALSVAETLGATRNGAAYTLGTARNGGSGTLTAARRGAPGGPTCMSAYAAAA